MKSTFLTIPLFILPLAHGFTSMSSFVVRSHQHTNPFNYESPKMASRAQTRRSKPRSTLSMIDQNIILGGGIAVGSFALGIGLVAFTENQGERAKARGSGLSDDMSTKIAGSLMEDYEVSSVSDLNSLTTQLEAALKETKGDEMEDMEMTEEAKQRIAEELDEGW